MRVEFWTKSKQTIEGACVSGLPMLAVLIGMLVLDPLVNLPFPATLALITAALGIGWLWAWQCAARNEQELIALTEPVLATARLDVSSLVTPLPHAAPTRGPVLFVFSSLAQQQQRDKPKTKPASNL